VLHPHLEERQRRLLEIEASELGRGGIAVVTQVTGCLRTLLSVEFEYWRVGPQRCVRPPGGGPMPLSRVDPETAGGAAGVGSMSPLVVDRQVDHESGYCADADWASGLGSDGGSDAPGMGFNLQCNFCFPPALAASLSRCG
jgi:hypothetical protein